MLFSLDFPHSICYTVITYMKTCVTIQAVLGIYCTVREKVIQECINPIAKGDFKWIYAVTGHGVNSNKHVLQQEDNKHGFRWNCNCQYGSGTK